jgi:hypothetical protein
MLVEVENSGVPQIVRAGDYNLIKLTIDSVSPMVYIIGILT